MIDNAVTNRTRFLWCLAWGLLLNALSPSSAHAQAAMEDSKGRSTVLIDAPSIGINTADSSLQLTLTHMTNISPIVYGVLVKGKAENGIASLVTNGEAQPGFEFGGAFGWKSATRAVGVKAVTQISKLSLFDAAATPDDALTKPTKATGEIAALANFVLASAGEPHGFAAFGVSARHVNNWDSLKKTKVVRRKGAMPPTGFESQELVTETEARTGQLLEGWIGNLDGDVILQSNDLPLSLRGYFRLSLAGESTLKEHKVGIDVTIIKDSGDILLDRRLSVFLEFTDVPEGESSWGVGLGINLPLAIFK